MAEAIRGKVRRLSDTKNPDRTCSNSEGCDEFGSAVVYQGDDCFVAVRLVSTTTTDDEPYFTGAGCLD
jgi:hypothetical protein